MQPPFTLKTLLIDVGSALQAIKAALRGVVAAPLRTEMLHRREIHRMQESRVTARLPRLDVEIIRQQAADEEGESLCIRLHARPTFKAWGEFLLQDRMPPTFLWWTNPFVAWTQMLESLWQPWLMPLARGGPGADGDAEVLPLEPAVRPARSANAMHRSN